MNCDPDKVVTSIFEPTPRFSRGVHKAVEVDTERLTALLRAIEVAQTVGEAAPLVSLIGERVSVNLDPQQFFHSDDGYPAAGNLDHYVVEIARADDVHDFGLGVLGEIFAADLRIGKPLVDESKAMSPEWLAAEIDLPFAYCEASELLQSVDFGAGINDEALAAASEAFDMGELGDDISGVGDFQVDALDDWAARLRDALADFRFALEDIEAREGTVLTWYER